MDDKVNQNMTREEIINIVSKRILELKKENNFSLSIDYFKQIHSYLFTGIYSFAGEFRKDNLFKKEYVLNEETIFYSNYQNINTYLKYDLDEEKNYNYNNKDIDKIIKHISKFVSNIWQVHPFLEGNTRTVMVFIINYLKELGYEINNQIFKQNFTYFRNALVLSNYYEGNKIVSDMSYLNKFFENLILGKNEILDIEDFKIGRRSR